MKHVQCYKTKRNRTLKTILNFWENWSIVIQDKNCYITCICSFLWKLYLIKNILCFTNSYTCQIMQSTFTHNNQLVLLTYTINPDIWTILETVGYIYAKHNYHVCAQVRNANVIIIYVQFQFKSLRRCITPALHYCS